MCLLASFELGFVSPLPARSASVFALARALAVCLYARGGFAVTLLPCPRFPHPSCARLGRVPFLVELLAQAIAVGCALAFYALLLVDTLLAGKYCGVHLVLRRNARRSRFWRTRVDRHLGFRPVRNRHRDSASCVPRSASRSYARCILNAIRVRTFEHRSCTCACAYDASVALKCASISTTLCTSVCCEISLVVVLDVCALRHRFNPSLVATRSLHRACALLGASIANRSLLQHSWHGPPSRRTSLW